MTARARARSRFGVGVAAGWAAMIVGAAAGWPAPLPSGRIALLESPESSQVARYCLTRIREELAAGGFQVLLVDSGPRLDPVSIVGVMEAQEGVVATIALLGNPERPGAELWILDRIGATPEVRRISMHDDPPEHLPEVLAIRTMELLKASALKALVESTRARREIAPPPTAPATSPLSPDAGTHAVGAEVGVSLLESVGGPGPATLPLVRVRAWVTKTLFARLTIAGLGSRPRIETPIGSASVAQSLGLAEVAFVFRPGARWRPAVALGAGALHVRSEGQGMWPYAGVNETCWVAAFDAGVGLLLGVATHLSLSFELHTVLAVPHPKVRFYDVESTPLAFPALLASFTMVAWL